ISYQTASYQLNYGTVAISDHLWFRPGVELTGGLRLGFGSNLVDGFCFEGFGRIALVPHFNTAVDAAGRTASWRPSVGLEIGGTSAERQFGTGTAPSSIFKQLPGPGGVYAGLAARPLRFRLSSFNASAAGVTFATMIKDPGRQLRLQIEILEVGV